MGTQSSSGTSSGGSVTPAAAAAAPATALLVGWVRLADVAQELNRSRRRLREMVAEIVPESQQQRRPRPAGGSPEVWITLAAAEHLRAAVTSGGSSGDASGGAVATPAAAAEPPAAPVATGEDPAAGWRELVSQLRADLDTARSQLETERVARQEAARRAEEAERGRYSAEVRLETLRAAWWHWRTLLDALGPVARLRRRWPDTPAELVADRLLARPEG